MKKIAFILSLFIIPLQMLASGCESAIKVQVESGCNYKKYNLSAGVGTVSDRDCGWCALRYNEVWLETQMPKSGRLSIGTDGHYIDGFMSVYSGSCNALSPIKCSNNGRLPEVLEITEVTPGTTLFIRIGLVEDNSVSVCIQEMEKIEYPKCTTSTIAANHCSEATLIQTPNGYCGNTSSDYSAETPGNLQNEFCGSIENNSWIQFVASEEKASLNVFVRNCKNGIGVQMRIYETTDCNYFIPYSNCWNPAIETNGVVTATGLTPGQRYYLMIDGYAGDVCDYTISAGEGVETPQTFIEDIICKGERYTKHGFDVSEPGVYKQTLVGPTGKDSIVVLSLTVQEPMFTYLSDSIYACERYTKNGFDVNTQGKHYLHLSTVAGCDSTIELSLKVLPYKEFFLNAAICNGESYELNGFSVSKAGTYKKTFKTALGCDSIVTLELTVQDGLDLHVDGKLDICSGESTTLYASGGNKYTWLDADRNIIGTGETLTLSPATTTSYILYSKNEENCPATLTDCEGHSYPAVKIGEQCWMAENLKCKTFDTESELAGYYLMSATIYAEDFGPYYFDPKNGTSEYDDNLTAAHRQKLGYLYSWAGAVALPSADDALSQITSFAGNRQGICPNGWHVPTTNEVNTLCNTVGGSYVAGKKLKSKDGWYKGRDYMAGTDEYNFTMLPAGFSVGNYMNYIGANGSLWTSTPMPGNYEAAYDWFTFYTTDILERTNNEKFYGRPVRCIKNSY